MVAERIYTNPCVTHHNRTEIEVARMKILLTGGSGYIGRNLLRLWNGNHEVYALSRQKPDSDETKGIQWIETDLEKGFSANELPKTIDAVVHLAQARARFPAEAKELFTVNVASTFIMASSGNVYTLGTKPHGENETLNAPDFYATTKQLSETILHGYKDYFTVINLRLFAPYGPGQIQRMIPTIIEKVRAGQPVTLNNNGQPRTNPIYIDDLVSVFDQTLRLTGFQTINVAGPDIVSIEDLARLAGAALGREPFFERHSVPAVWDLIGDISRMHSLFRPTSWIKPSEGIRRVVEVQLSNV